MKTAQFRLARYRETDVHLHRGNPLIEALPPAVSSQKQAQLIRRELPYNEEERNLPNHHRVSLLDTLSTFRVVMPEHIELFSQISRMIHLGYISRNPITNGICRNMPTDEDLVDYEPDRIDIDPPGMSLLGCSGIGKTQITRRILQRHPQVIEHSGYKGEEFHMIQVVWLILECPHDGSIKGLINNFFTELDRLLGTKYSQMHGASRRSAVDMIPRMAWVAHIHRLGLLVIDEIQNLSRAASGGQQAMLNFFTSISNQMHLPIMRIGTPQALGILSGQFRTGRRATGMGCMLWERMEKNVLWERFLKALWHYQYTRVPAKLTPELVDTMYDETQGIAQLAVTLYSLAQSNVIGGRETLDSTVLRDVAAMSFKPVQPYLNALKTGNPAFVDMQDLNFRVLREHINEIKRAGVLGPNTVVEIKTVARESAPKSKKQADNVANLPTEEMEETLFEASDVGV